MEMDSINNTPMYVRLYLELKEEISSGLYARGSFLPTEAELMRTYQVSRTTVRNALKLLVKDGLAESRQGRGTMVLGQDRIKSTYHYLSIHNTARITSRFRDTEKEPQGSSLKATIDIMRATDKIASELQVSTDDNVFRLQRIKFADDEPFSYVTSYLPTALFPDLDKHNEEIVRLYKFLNEHYGIMIEHIQDVIASEPADFITARILGIPVHSPLLVERRTAYTRKGPVEYAESMINGSKMEYVVNSYVKDPTAFLGKD